MLSRIVMLSLATIANGGVIAQQVQPSQSSQPKTKIEAFTGISGSVLIKSYVVVGTVRGTGKISLTAMTFRNARTSQNTTGLAIEVAEASSRSERESRSFVDYDEIADLIEGVGYISRANAQYGNLKFFEATFKTRGDLYITVF